MREAAYKLLDGKRIRSFLIEIVEVECGTIYGSLTDTEAKLPSIPFNLTTSEGRLLDPATVRAVFSAFEHTIDRRLDQIELAFS